MATQTLQARLADSRLVSAVEFTIGALIVIGHNVFRVVPNEVPILFVLGLVSARVRDGGWGVLGLRRPESWRRIVLIALAAAAVRILAGDLVIDPLTSRIWPPIKAPEMADTIPGSLTGSLVALLIVWTFAAFGEEIGYRGYLLTRAAEAGGKSTLSWWTAMILVSVLFGYGHYYKGPAGIVDSGMAGFVLGTAYLLSGRNLWVCILGHGFIDTFAIIALYFGWAS